MLLDTFLVGTTDKLFFMNSTLASTLLDHIIISIKYLIKPQAQHVFKSSPSNQNIFVYFNKLINYLSNAVTQTLSNMFSGMQNALEELGVNAKVGMQLR